MVEQSGKRAGTANLQTKQTRSCLQTAYPQPTTTDKLGEQPIHMDLERQRRILIIEDNRDCADSLGVLLKISGHQVQVAYSGQEGIDLALQWQPDVVFCDLGLPGRDGFEVAQHLRQQSNTAATKLVAILAYSGLDVTQRAKESGFDMVLTKPADPGQLLAFVGRVQ